MRKVTMIAGVMILGLLMASAAQATIIAEHTGSNDPTGGEGFSLVGGSGATLEANAGPPANWSITRGNYEAYYSKAVTAADFDDPTGWTLTLEQKISTPGYRFSAGVWVGDGHSRIILLAGNTGDTPADAMYAWNAGDDTGAQIGTGKATDWHTWQLYLSPHATDPDLDQMELYQDGTLVDTIGRGSFYSDTGTTFLWGQLSVSDQITQQYATVRLETGKHIVPEPSTLGLLSTGLIGLLAYAWRKRK